MPEKRKKTSLFIEYCNKYNLTCESLFLDDEDLLQPILEDEKEAKKLFEDLKTLKIKLYKLTKTN